jgi:hypothetical protein
MQHFLFSSISSLFLISSPIFSYWTLTRQFIEKQVQIQDRFQIVSISQDVLQSQRQSLIISPDSVVYVSCAGDHLSKNSTVHQYTQEILEHYQKNELFSFFNSHSSDFSCSVFDLTSSSLILISDAAGSVPIWYYLDVFYSAEALPIPLLFTTTDLLLSFQFGIYRVNSVPPNSMITFDTTSNEIVDIKSLLFQSGRRSPSIPAHQFQSIAKELSDLATQALRDSLSKINYSTSADQIIMEIDEMQWISKLLDCSADHLQLSREIRKTRPYVIQNPSNKNLSPELKPVIDAVVDADKFLGLREP